MERQHVLTQAGLEVFDLEDPVVLRNQEPVQVGEIVGVRMLGSDVLYDVSCETCTFKALFEDELDLATAPVLQGELNAILNTAMANTLSVSGREGRRRTLLRNDHVTFLRRAIDHIQRSRIEEACASMPYSVGDRLALRSGEAFDLCVVSGMRLQDGNVLAQVDCMGEIRLAPDDDLLPLADAPKPGHGLSLGGRARFVVAGREDDTSFEGVICRIEPKEDDWRFSLSFDDGDVFEDLDTADLRPCANDSALS